jgi:hypothetical protein
MDKNVIYSLVAGLIIYFVVIYLAYIQRDLTGQQLVLMIVAPIVIGILSGGIKKGIIIAAVVSLVMMTLEVVVLMSGAISDLNVLLTIMIMMALPWVAISAGLGAVGGLISRRLFKKK